jgi:hypothetical protein
VPVPTFRDHPATPVADIEGRDLAGGPVALRVSDSGVWTLLLFLSSGCRGCEEFWTALADPAGPGLAGEELAVAVTRDRADEDMERLRALAGATVPVLMSSAAWDSYRVQGPPFFVLVDGRGEGDIAAKTVATEGVAMSAAQVAADVRRAQQAGGPGVDGD